MFFAIAVLFAGLVLGVKKRSVKVDFEADYYFLVETCEDSTAAAVAGKVYGSGGAGMLLEGGKAVVVACYYTVRDAERVRDAMREKGVETQIYKRSAKIFYLDGAEAEFAERVRGNAETVSTCARLLYDTANRLERAETGQAGARAVTEGVVQSLRGLIAGNAEGFFDRWNAKLAEAARSCSEIGAGIVFAKDLRRTQADLLNALVGLGSFF